MPSSIFFNGFVTRVPGSYSKVDASGLESVGLGSNGVVAILAEGQGGKPVSEMTEPNDFLRFSTPSSLRGTFIGGDMREAGSMIFEPGNDEQIQGGAQQVIAMKVNPATQGTAVLSNAAGDAIDLTAGDWGAHTNQVNVSIASGTNQGKLVTVIFEDITVSDDDIGGDDLFTLTYTSGSDSFDTMNADVQTGGEIRCVGTRDESGLDGDIGTTLASDGVVEVVSSAAGDVGQTVIVYGLLAGGTEAAREVFTLNGTTTQVGTKEWEAGDVLGVEVIGTTTGTVTVAASPGGANIFSMGAGTNPNAGVVKGEAMFVADEPLQCALDAAGTPDVVVVGTTASGSVAVQRVLLAATSNEIGVASNVSATLTWAGTTTITTADTSEVEVGNWLRLNSDGQWFRVTAVVEDTSITIANPHELTIPSGATTSGLVTNALDFAKITAVALGDVAAARTITMTANAARTDGTVHTTLQKVADYFNARAEGTSGFELELKTGDLDFDPSDLDIDVGVTNILNPLEPGFGADNYAIIEWLNTNASEYVTAAASAGATGGAPDNTSSPVFLTGGSEGTTTFSDYQDALNLLKQFRVNTIVAWTGDPAVHSAIEAHCAYMAGIGRSERDSCVGLQNAAEDGPPTKTEAKNQIIDLNSRHIRAFAQTCERFNTDGVRTTFQPYALATLAAGMQAGSPVGTSLTWKYPSILAFGQDSTWNPTDDAEEMLAAGLMFVENNEGVGRRFVRNITTYLKSNNLAFTEASVNEAANFATFEFRNAMEFAVGRKGFAGTRNAAAGVAIKKLGLLVDEEILTAYRALTVDIVTEVMDISVEMAPIIPINFVKSTIHLVTT